MTVERVFMQDGVIPVLSVKSAEEAVWQTRAILQGGLHTVELTLRSECAMEAIAVLSKQFPDACIGAGTVLNGEQAKQAIEKGARFIVSPGWSQEVWSVCKTAAVFYLPGCVTPTEMMTALSFGVRTVKFFPASVYGGATAIQALSAPLSSLRFVPTGGVNPQNLNSYLSMPCILAAGGSWMFGRTESETERSTREAVALVSRCR